MSKDAEGYRPVWGTAEGRGPEKKAEATGKQDGPNPQRHQIATRHITHKTPFRAT